jgi:hypothetical protein
MLLRRERALALHATAYENCFIARSVNFAVGHFLIVEVTEGAARLNSTWQVRSARHCCVASFRLKWNFPTREE